MTQRERQRMKIVLIAAGIFGAGLVIYLTFLGPYFAGQDELARLEEDNHDKDRQIAVKKKEKQQVERFRFMSLAGPQNEAVTQYDKFLKQTLKASGLGADEIQVPASEAKAAATQGGKKPPPHTVLTFLIVSKGELANVVRFLELMEKAPYAHRVKSLDLRQDSDKKKEGQLSVRVTVEAMIVNKAERYANLQGRLAALDALSGLRRGPIGINMIPWIISPVSPDPRFSQPRVTGRSYDSIAQRNVFIGAKPYVPPDDINIAEIEDPNAVDTRKWWFLSGISQANFETLNVKSRMAILRNYLEDVGSVRGYQKLLQIEMSGYDQFRIRDESGNRVLVHGKVVRIDARDVYFTVDNKYYSIHAGENVYEAMERGVVPRAELERLRLVNPATAREDKEADKKAPVE